MNIMEEICIEIFANDIKIHISISMFYDMTDIQTKITANLNECSCTEKQL